MARNVEIKARVRDPRRLAACVRALCGRPVRRMTQQDTFFRVPRGRLKLRVTGPGPGELIAYERPNVAGPKGCSYDVVRVADPNALRRALAHCLGVTGTVRKARRLFMLGATRVHLDRVEGLGDFLELEVVLAPGQSLAYGQRTARVIMQRLGIGRRDLVDRAYIDLLRTDRRRS